LGISLATVKTHVANILKKFDVASRAGLPFIIEEEETVQ
jgi:DNA-binding NarL/FixJ family response regulator